MNDFIERRKYPRTQARFKTTLRLENDKKKIEAFARDISSGGIFLETNRLLGPNDIVEISFKLPQNDKKYTLTGQVVRLEVTDNSKNDENYIYGAAIFFTEIDEKIRDTINTFIEKNK